jgi:hypothetical protein
MNLVEQIRALMSRGAPIPAGPVTWPSSAVAVARFGGDAPGGCLYQTFLDLGEGGAGITLHPALRCVGSRGGWRAVAVEDGGAALVG